MWLAFKTDHNKKNLRKKKSEKGCRWSIATCLGLLAGNLFVFVFIFVFVFVFVFLFVFFIFEEEWRDLSGSAGWLWLATCLVTFTRLPGWSHHHHKYIYKYHKYFLYFFVFLVQIQILYQVDS